MPRDAKAQLAQRLLQLHAKAHWPELPLATQRLEALLLLAPLLLALREDSSAIRHPLAQFSHRLGRPSLAIGRQTGCGRGHRCENRDDGQGGKGFGESHGSLLS